MDSNKITVCSPYCIMPPTGGGKQRMFQLYRRFSKSIPLEMVCLQQETVDVALENCEIAQGLSQITVPKTRKHLIKDRLVDRRCGNLFVYDASLIYHINCSPMYAKAVEESVKTSKAIILSSNPYLFPVVNKIIGDRPLIYDAHDVSFLVKKNLLKNLSTRFGRSFLNNLFEVEKACCKRADIIMVCSEEDRQHMHQLFGIDQTKIHVVANGVDTRKIEYVNISRRLQYRANLNLPPEKIGVFIGSAHYPNFEAAENIFKIARQCPEAFFFLIGSQCHHYENADIPANVMLLGIVDDKNLNAILNIADFSINPIVSGSGTNVKMFEYMSAGIPIIASEFATRGIEDKRCFIVSEIENMPKIVNSFDIVKCENRVEAAYNYVKKYFDWDNIAQSILKKIEAVVGDA